MSLDNALLILGRVGKDLFAISSHSAHGDGASGWCWAGVRAPKVANLSPSPIQQEEPPKRLFLRVGLPFTSDATHWGGL